MNKQENELKPFSLKDCSLVALATGKKAQNLREMRDHLEVIHLGSIYYHFWGGLLRPRFDDPQFNNDFAIWSHYSLHDDILAERLAVIDPTDFFDLEFLRRELIEVIEQRLEEIGDPTWAAPDLQFHFVRSQVVVFDTGILIDSPEHLTDAIPEMSLGSVFYHFIDGRRRPPQGLDDFRAWLSGFEGPYDELCDALAGVDPFFTTLSDLRKELSSVFEAFFRGGAR
jgi:hypothetical protein